MKKLLIALLLPLVTCVAMLAPSVATADSGSTLTVVGTSDVSDSGLFQNVIAPAFEAEYPQFQIHYVGTASGTAIADAETGQGASGGASVLLVHAASLENQFVAGDYSYDNQPGYAVFRNDFVLAGPTADPAGVTANAANNAPQAFADIAIAGYNGGGTPSVTFVSRGGTPGTTVEEHEIWQLASTAGLLPSTVPLCTVSSADGGGETPVAAVISNDPGFVSGSACSSLPTADQTTGTAAGLPTGAALPAWYVVTGATQGPNVQDANACTGYASAANTCYVLTDRGTFDYLESGIDPAGSITHLAIVTREDSSTAPGGQYALINYFHAYIINQATVQSKTGSSSIAVNLPAAQDFVSLLTSASFQTDLSHYLAYTSTTGGQLDPGGPPFVGDAAPIITEAGLNPNTAYGDTLTVTGSVTNAEPGYPALANETVAIDEIVGGVPVEVASGTTTATGSYSIAFKPKSSGEYEVSTAQLTPVENAALSPTFSDTLSPALGTVTAVTVRGAPAAHSLNFGKVSSSGKKKGKGTLKVAEKLSPSAALNGGKVKLFAFSVKSGREKQVASATLKEGKASVTVTAKLAAGRYVLQLAYTHTGLTTVYSGLKAVTVR
jgi:ABC-type tungstate transport system permease subunit